jgi:hypothetical protein
MPSARTSSGLRAGALTSVIVVVGAGPAGATIAAHPHLSAGCAARPDGSVVCAYSRPSAQAVVVDVPDGVTSARISVRGGSGGLGSIDFGSVVPATTTPAGAGGSAAAVLRVDPAKNLEVRVGGAGASGIDGGAGGVGGGPGGKGSVGTFAGGAVVRGGGGGGGSEVRIAGTDPATADPLIAAGGGGGGGSGPPFPRFLPLTGGPGGAGGGVNGAPGGAINSGTRFGGAFAGGGSGGSQSAPGAGGALVVGVPVACVGADGTRGAGGDAVQEMPGLFAGGTGAGGGGGGYYGGGGGSAFTGGGGGSGFGPSGTRFGSGLNSTSEFRHGSLTNGEVIIEFAPPGRTYTD